jgi:hypothetical protein
MDTLIDIIISGIAVSFIVEYLIMVTGGLFNARIVRAILTLPLSAIACWYLDIFGFELIVAAPASAFLSLAATLLVNRPTEVTQVVSRRR